MAGNPFRKAAGRPDVQIWDREATTPPIKTRTTKKRVKIQTPPHSPEEPPRRPSAGHISPPPPPTTSLEKDDDSSDSTATADSELEEALRNTRRNSGSTPSAPSAGTPSNGAPYNPFARTLATSNAQFGIQQANTYEEPEAPVDRDETRAAAAKPAMDVDQFKNILMTGSAAPSASGSAPFQRQQDNSSSTDTSSVSRQSLFDPVLDVHPGTPRSSFEEAESASEDEYNQDDDEGSNLMSGTDRLDDLAPPAPPKHTHGNLLTSKGPQTVSFADFNESFPTQTPPTTATANEARKPKPSARVSSDLNKPLPPPPMSPVTAHAPTVDTDVAQQQPPPEITMTQSSPQHKKAPPPPPTSRRAGQSSTSTTHGRDRSTSDPKGAAHAEGEAEHPMKATDTAYRTAAPAPPPRKSRPSPQLEKSSLMTSSDAPQYNQIPNDHTPMPPPPPRRTPSKTGSSIVRTPSNTSQASVSRVSGNTTPASSSAPPAPPPRRGGKRESIEGPPNTMAWAMGSQRHSSGDRRRGSGTSFDSERSTSLSNLQHVAESTEAPETAVAGNTAFSQSDILADMAAFQAELEALRTKTSARDENLDFAT